MCTAVTYKTKDFYFGRTLDYEFSYGEKIVIMPRNYNLQFRHISNLKNNYAIIGMAHIEGDYPLFYDAINEKGLAMAGLNFVGNASYNKVLSDKDNVCQFEFISYILRNCQNINETLQLLKDINITDEAFSDTLPSAQLHWIIADSSMAITVEVINGKMNIYKNSVGVLTNNPPFNYQMFNLNNYINISNKDPENNFSSNLELNKYSRGMGAIGLPGDLSSMSRFVRATFVKMNSLSKDDELSSVSQFFHILNSVQQQRGCCKLKDDQYEISIYTSCCNTNKGIYYYTTYDNHQINAVDIHKENLDGNDIISYSLIDSEQINYQN